MANVTQTAAAGAALYASTPREADDASDNKASDGSGAYEHRAVDFSATEKGEIVSRLLYHESMVGLSLWNAFR